jgi:MinD-like ATPase involved in chromosome partitioning or flagellar assembly
MTMNRQLDSLRSFTAGRARSRRDAKHVIVVAGAKGGTGSTTVSTLLALGATRLDHDVLLVDAAASGSPTADLFAVSDYGIASDDAFRLLGPRLTLARRPTGDALTTMERRDALRRAASRYDEHDIVVVDAGSSGESIAAAIGAGSGALLVVTAPDRLSAAAAYAIVKFAAESFPDLPVHVLANQTDAASARLVFDRVAAGVTEFLGRTVMPAGQIPDDATLRAAIENGLDANFGAGPAFEAGRLLAEQLIARRADRMGPALHLS